MKPSATEKTWNKTRRPNLVRHKSGKYYARIFANGKEIWKTLRTAHLSIANARLKEILREVPNGRNSSARDTSPKMRFGEALELHRVSLGQNVELKQRTRDYWSEVSRALVKSWPKLEQTKLRKISPEACKGWAKDYSGLALIFRTVNEGPIPVVSCLVGIQKRSD